MQKETYIYTATCGGGHYSGGGGEEINMAHLPSTPILCGKYFNLYFLWQISWPTVKILYNNVLKHKKILDYNVKIF